MDLILPQYESDFNDMPSIKKFGRSEVYANTNKSVHQQRIQVLKSPSSAAPSTMANLANSTVEFRLENEVDRITHTDLRIEWSNTSGANMVSCTYCAFPRQVQIFSDNGSKLLYTLNSNVVNYLSDVLFKSREHHENTAALRGTTDAYGNGTITHATATSGTIIIPIAELFWHAKIRPYEINGNLLIKVSFVNTATLISSGAMNINSVQLAVHGYYESEPQQKMVKSRSLQPKNLFYYAIQEHSETLALGASSTASIRLSGIKGHIPLLAFFIRDVANISSPAAQFSCLRVQSFEVTNEKNQSIVGYSPVSEVDMLNNFAFQFPNKLLLNWNIHVYSWTQSPVGDMALGSFNGGSEFNGFHSLKFTCKSTMASSTYEVLTFGFTSESLKFNHGNVSASRV